jgi:phosphatidylglycerophosphate synthase
MQVDSESWKTKPTDRFVLRWIKLHLSARVTPRLLGFEWLEPWMITLFSAGLGVLGGACFALTWGFAAGCIAGCAQVLDGVDGQFARITGKQSRGGAFWDSVLDRYADGAMMIGMTVYLLREPSVGLPPTLVLVLAFLAITGGSLISYSSARAESLALDMGKPTLASKGTRSTVMILCALGSLLLPSLPLVALIYLAVHPNLVVAGRLRRTLTAP